jgi:hypothetical protein
MATKFIVKGVCLDSISNEEDLKLRPGININPPPADGRCMCCGRHLSELKPYGKAGDPLVGDFEGALLLKTFRPDYLPDEEAEEAYDKAMSNYKSEGYDDPLDWMKKEYGEDEGEALWEFAINWGVGKSWECRDCIVLDRKEYFEKREQRYYKEVIKNCHEQHDDDDEEELLRELENL